MFVRKGKIMYKTFPVKEEIVPSKNKQNVDDVEESDDEDVVNYDFNINITKLMGFIQSVICYLGVSTIMWGLNCYPKDQDGTVSWSTYVVSFVIYLLILRIKW